MAAFLSLLLCQARSLGSMFSSPSSPANNMQRHHIHQIKNEILCKTLNTRYLFFSAWLVPKIRPEHCWKHLSVAAGDPLVHEHAPLTFSSLRRNGDLSLPSRKTGGVGGVYGRRTRAWRKVGDRGSWVIGGAATRLAAACRGSGCWRLRRRGNSAARRGAGGFGSAATRRRGKARLRLTQGLCLTSSAGRWQGWRPRLGTAQTAASNSSICTRT